MPIYTPAALLMIEPIPLEDLALLDVLQQISQSGETVLAPEIKRRLVESALIEEDEEGVRLSYAGIALCKSLQHRLAADKLAGQIIENRENAAGSPASSVGEPAHARSSTTS